jgi:hypothetical protein
MLIGVGWGLCTGGSIMKQWYDVKFSVWVYGCSVGSGWSKVQSMVYRVV